MKPLRRFYKQTAVYFKTHALLPHFASACWSVCNVTHGSTATTRHPTHVNLRPDDLLDILHRPRRLQRASSSSSTSTKLNKEPPPPPPFAATFATPSRPNDSSHDREISHGSRRHPWVTTSVRLSIIPRLQRLVEAVSAASSTSASSFSFKRSPTTQFQLESHQTSQSPSSYMGVHHP